MQWGCKSHAVRDIEQHWLSVVLILLFIFGGAGVFWRVEGYNSGFQPFISAPCNASNPNHAPLTWSYSNSLYFVIVTLTTVGTLVLFSLFIDISKGYGDIVPATEAGRIFDCFFMLIGIPVVGYCINILPEMIVSFVKGVMRRVTRREGTSHSFFTCLSTVLSLAIVSSLVLSLSLFSYCPLVSSCSSQASFWSSLSFSSSCSALSL